MSEDWPLNVQKVLKIVKREKRPVTVSDISKHTEYRPRTIRGALKRLVDEGLLVYSIDLKDPRRHLYKVR